MTLLGGIASLPPIGQIFVAPWLGFIVLASAAPVKEGGVGERSIADAEKDDSRKTALRWLRDPSRHARPPRKSLNCHIFVLHEVRKSPFFLCEAYSCVPNFFSPGKLAQRIISTDGWQKIQWAGFAFVVSAILLICLLTWQRLQAEERLLDSNARAQQQSLATIISENLTQVMDRGRTIAVGAESWLGGNRKEAEQRLANMLAIDQVFLNFSLYDTSLRRIYSSSPNGLAAVSREALDAAVKESDRTSEQPVAVLGSARSQEQMWAVPVLFAITGESGSRKGFILITVDMGYFLGLYRNINIGRSGVIRILTEDGTELAEARAEGLTHRRQRQRHADLAALATTDDVGGFTGELHGQAGYLANARHVERSPFIVVVSRELAEVRASHVRGSIRAWAYILVLGAVLALATWVLIRGFRRQQMLFSALLGADGEKRSLIAQLKEEKTRAVALASFDHLTGLHNRRMFNELAASHLEVARRSRKHYALVYLDLDRFKSINDTLGHHVGDLLLQAMSARLRAGLRSADIVGRMGGDEFAVLLTELDCADSVDPLARKLLHHLSEPYQDLDGHDIQTSPSMGIALFPRDGHDVGSLCRNADAAMYTAKRLGRGCLAYYDAALELQADRASRLQDELPRAIEQDELVLHFQPKVRLADYRISGFEALVRWEHPELGLLYPRDFIPLAEQTGMIVLLGDWVMRACCAQQANWTSQGVEIVPVAFNLSPRQLRDAGLSRRIAELLTSYGLEARHIEIEITESSLVEPLQMAVQVLEELQQMGVLIGLDDFGSGYSNLSQVRNLPINNLKIDRSFINDIRGSREAGVIVTSIITLAHSLGIRVIAEGVELLDQLIQLKTAGCDEVQGYYLSRPVPAQEALVLLQQSTIVPQ